MGSILEKYGIKEVADICFYTIGADGKPGNPVLFIDTAKTSTTETSADSVYAQGGKGNPRLIGWDFNKNITLNLEDALFTMKSMALMYGALGNEVKGSTTGTIRKTIEYVATDTTVPTEYQWTDINGNQQTASNIEIYDQNGTETTENLVVGTKYYMTFTVAAKTQEIRISPDRFPGTYYICCDTFCRSEANGMDDYFQLIIPKGKITSDTTLTLEADGDPTVFSMAIDVLRAKDEDGQNIMMKLVKYGFDGEGNTGDGNIKLVEN